MTWVLLIALIIFAAIAFLLLKLKQTQKPEDEFPYEKSGPLFSAAERSFLGVLQQAVGEEFAILGKVRIADVVEVKSLRNRAAWRRAFNRINAKHFDYVVCSKGDYSVVAVVELDDKSHQQRKRKERDEFVAKLCREVSLPLLQVPAQRAYAITEIQNKFMDLIGRQAVSAQTTLSSTSSVDNEGKPQPILSPQPTKSLPAEQVIKVELGTEDPLCPKCSASMILREIKTGSKAGQKFWGCSTFPKCRGVTVGG